MIVCTNHTGHTPLHIKIETLQILTIPLLLSQSPSADFSAWFPEGRLRWPCSDSSLLPRDLSNPSAARPDPWQSPARENQGQDWDAQQSCPPSARWHVCAAELSGDGTEGQGDLLSVNKFFRPLKEEYS